MSRDFAISGRQPDQPQEPKRIAPTAYGRWRGMSGALRAGWILVPVFWVAMGVLWWADFGDEVMEPPYLLTFLNFAFRTAIAVFIAYLAAQSFSRSGSLAVLALGCGALFFGLSSLVSGLAINLDAVNLGITVYNIGAWFAGACHLFGAIVAFSPGGRIVPNARLVVSTAYAIILVLLVILVFAAFEGLTPVFIVPGEGATTIRQVVVFSAAGMFGLAAVMIGAGSWHRSPEFAKGYALALILIATGLLGFMVPVHVGTPISWVGRTAQYAGSLVMLGAVLIACRRSGDWEALLHEALESSEQRFRTLAEATFEGIVISDNGVIVDVNDQYARILGYEREELLGRAVSPFLPNEGELDASETGVSEGGLTRKDGTPLLVAVRGRTLPRHGRKVRFFAIRDITERKKQEQALLDSRNELEKRVAERTAELRERADQLARLTSELALTEQREKGRLARILHDHLQQLLVGAKLGLEILGRKLSMTERKAVSCIEKTLNEAIEASRSLTVELSPPILHEGELADALHWLARWAQPKLGLTVKVKIDETVVEGREDVRILMFQAVRELLVNVSKYAQVPEVTVALIRMEEGGYSVQVRDRGAGFDPADLTSGPRDLTGGFGLFSIRERLDWLGGHLRIESSPGAGTCITLVGPREASERLAGETVASGEQSLIGRDGETGFEEITAVADDGRIRLLLVDDHAVMRQGLSALLGAEPDLVIVGEASDGFEAVEVARRLRPDMILMDFSMPRLDGVEATRILSAEQPDIVIIGLSMYEEADRAVAMVEAGAAGYLMKSGKSEDLLATIRRVSRQRSGNPGEESSGAGESPQS